MKTTLTSGKDSKAITGKDGLKCTNENNHESLPVFSFLIRSIFLDEGKASIPHLSERLTKELVSHINVSSYDANDG